MKSSLMILVLFCLALITSIVHGDNFANGVKMIMKLAKKGLHINGIFQPVRYLGRGCFAFTFSGTMLHPNSKSVAMKFTPVKDEKAAVKEYEMYTYLNAINNEDVERFGIPAVYYYGAWNNHILMAITLLDSTIDRSRASTGSIEIIDIFIMCQEFVRISKYIHYCGVRHNDMKMENIMFRKNQGFIIDFNAACKMYNSTDIDDRTVQRSLAKKDWLCFLYSTLKFLGIKFEKFHPIQLAFIFGGDINKQDLTHIIEQIETIKHIGLRRVFLEFAKHVVEDEINTMHLPNMSVNNNGSPFYDQVYQVIQEEMQKCKPETPAFVSWLTDRDRLNANNIPFEAISSIIDLFANATAEYPEVVPTYFDRIYPLKRNPS